jgi:hypothetical protein
MKKYIFLISGVAVFIIMDLIMGAGKKSGSYSDSDRLSNLEKAREAKKMKSILKDHEEINDLKGSVPIELKENEKEN